MKIPPVRIWAWILLPISFFLFWKAPSYFLEVKVDQEAITWPLLIEELHGDKWNRDRIPLDIDSSVLLWGNVKGSLILHILPDKNTDIMKILRTSNNDFWVYAAFEPVYDEELEQYIDVPPGTSISGLFQEDLGTTDALIRIAKLLGFESIYEGIDYLIKKYEKPILKKLWRKEFFIFNSLAGFLLILMGFLLVSFTIKDIVLLGYNRKMKMLHWWHYFFFLPRTVDIIKLHFEKEKDRLEDLIKDQLFEKFKKEIKLSKKIHITRLKEVLYSQGKDEAKKYCLIKLKAWNFQYKEARIFLLKNFYEFIALSPSKQSTVISNLEKQMSLSSVSLSELTIVKTVKTSRTKFNVQKSVIDPRTIFLEELDEKFHWQYYEYEELINSLHHSDPLIDCFADKIDDTYRHLQLKRIEQMFEAIHVKDIAKYIEKINSFSIDDIIFSLSVLFKLEELRLRWNERDKYIKLLISKKWDKKLLKLFETKESWIPKKLEILFSPVQEKSKNTKKITGMKFLIVSDYLSDKQENNLTKVFKKHNSKVFILKGTTRSKPRVDHILLLTSLMSHSTGSFYKKNKNRLYVPFINGERIINFLTSL